MPLFTFRRQNRESKGLTSPGGLGNNERNSGALAESVEVIRRRVRHRLIGSVVLVLVGIGLFPLLFESQPRPVPSDIAVEIPGRTAYKALVLPPAPVPAALAAASAAAAAKPLPQPPVVVAAATNFPVAADKPTAKVSEPNRPAAQETPAQAAIKLEAKPVVARPLPPPAKPPIVAAAATSAGADDSARARALLNGEIPAVSANKNSSAADAAQSKPASTNPIAQSSADPTTTPAARRAVVQVGAFADAGKANEIRSRLEQAGLKSYLQAVETNDGKRIRVRVGPFSSRAEADKAAVKIRSMDLPAAILNL